MGGRHALLASVGLAVGLGSPVQSHDTDPTRYDCSIERHDDKKTWAVREIGYLRASWSLSTDQQTFVGASIWLDSRADTDAYLSQSSTAGPNNLITISTLRDVPKVGAWLTLQGNGISSGPHFHNRHDERYLAVSIDRDRFLQMAEGDGDIRMVWQSAVGSVLFEDQLRSAMVRETETELALLVRLVEYNRLSRGERCGEVIVLAN